MLMIMTARNDGLRTLSYSAQSRLNRTRNSNKVCDDDDDDDGGGGGDGACCV